MKGVERRHRRTDVAQQRHARLYDVGDRPERFDGLRPHGTVVARVGRVQHRKAVGVLFPVKIAAVDEDAANRRAVTPDVFGGRMHDDRGAVLDRLAQHRAGSVVHDERDAHCAADFGDLGDREDGELGIRQGLAIPAAGPRVARLAEIFRIGGVDEAAFDAHGAHGVLEQIPGAAIDVGRADEIVADVTDILHGEQRGGLSGGNRQSGDTAFECRHALLQHGLRRIHDAGVDIAELFEREQVAGVFGRIELIRRGLVDRHGNSRGGRIGPVSGMQDNRFCVLTGCRHEAPPLGWLSGFLLSASAMAA